MKQNVPYIKVIVFHPECITLFNVPSALPIDKNEMVCYGIDGFWSYHDKASDMTYIYANGTIFNK